MRPADSYSDAYSSISKFQPESLCTMSGPGPGHSGTPRANKSPKDIAFNLATVPPFNRLPERPFDWNTENSPNSLGMQSVNWLDPHRRPFNICCGRCPLSVGDPPFLNSLPQSKTGQPIFLISRRSESITRSLASHPSDSLFSVGPIHSLTRQFQYLPVRVCRRTAGLQVQLDQLTSATILRLQRRH